MSLLAGYAADRVLGDPARLHPVAGFGRGARSLEGRLWADSRARGITHVSVLVGGAVLLGAGVRRLPAATALATWAVLGGRSLEGEATAVHDLLVAGDLVAARQRLTHLVGRDTAELDEAEVARAVVESVAENTSDAVVAPLVWGALLGVPGLLGYRAANTLDAMIGHRSARRAVRLGRGPPRRRPQPAGLAALGAARAGLRPGPRRGRVAGLAA